MPNFYNSILFTSPPENDLVCDFFLGSFSTAKVAVGLGRRACGFELNKTAFDHQIKEIEKIKQGELLSELRQVPENKLVNKGKPLSQEETNQIVSEFKQLIQKGMPQKNACDTLSDKYGRGFWSILKMVSSFRHNGSQPQNVSLFD